MFITITTNNKLQGFWNLHRQKHLITIELLLTTLFVTPRLLSTLYTQTQTTTEPEKTFEINERILRNYGRELLRAQRQRGESQGRKCSQTYIMAATQWRQFEAGAIVALTGQRSERPGRAGWCPESQICRFLNRPTALGWIVSYKINRLSSQCIILHTQPTN